MMPSPMFKYAFGGALASYFFGYKSSQLSRPPPPPPPFPDRATSIYSAINWKTSVIGGSYALRQFRGNLNLDNERSDWEPKDIDIMIGSDSEEDFDREVKSFEERCPEAELTNQFNYREETFHKLVHGSRTYQHPTAAP